MAMSPEGAQTTMQFMNRVQLTGSEVQAWTRCIAELRSCIPSGSGGKTPPPAGGNRKKAGKKT